MNCLELSWHQQLEKQLPMDNSPYLFQSRYFAISELGIHLLRSGYNYNTVTYPEISGLEVRKGHELKNWIIVMIFGILLTGYALFDIFQIYQLFNNSIIYRMHVVRMIIPILPISLGVYSIWISSRKSWILLVKSKHVQHLSLKEYVEKNTLNEFIESLRSFYPSTTIYGL